MSDNEKHIETIDVEDLSFDMELVKENLYQSIAKQLGIHHKQVRNTVKLLEDGNTVPFIARYRKEWTGSLDEVKIRDIERLWDYGMMLAERKQTVLKSIAEQGKLTEELKDKLLKAETLTEVEDLYLPYKPKRRTKATIARERGLEPLAQAIMAQEQLEISLEEFAKQFVNPEKDVPDIDAAFSGAYDIIAEEINNDADLRAQIREQFFNTAVLKSSKSILFEDKEKEGKDPIALKEGYKYEMYFEFEQVAVAMPPHRVLAVNRGEREGVLSVTIEFDHEGILGLIQSKYINDFNSEFTPHLLKAIERCWKRYLSLAMRRELRRQITENAEQKSIKVFGENLKNLLLQPPLKDKTVMGIDPGYRTGCKIAVVDPTSKVLTTDSIYPHDPHKKWNEAKHAIYKMIQKYHVDIIAIGNGTASRETEKLVAEVINQLGLRSVKYIIVSEAGASVYSASDVAREEFPDLDVSIRGAISIARRVQDPLAELVKIDPRSIGVGQYQHDIPGLKKELDKVVVDAVNKVGVNINTASVYLLRYVSGLTKTIAQNIVKFREKHGKITSRKQLLDVPRLGPKTFEQCAGFLRILDSEDTPLDNTAVHPESYDLARKILELIGENEQGLINPDSRDRIQEKLSTLDPLVVSRKIQAEDRIETVKDIIQILQNPFRDPREDLPKPQLRSDVLSMEDLKEGMILEGTVTNVTDFGAFIDIGVKQSGLVHISELANRFVRHPSEVVKVGDIVKVKVISLDLQRERIGLSLKQALETDNEDELDSDRSLSVLQKSRQGGKNTEKSTDKDLKSFKKVRKKKKQKSEDEKIKDLFSSGRIRL